MRNLGLSNEINSFKNYYLLLKMAYEVNDKEIMKRIFTHIEKLKKYEKAYMFA